MGTAPSLRPRNGAVGIGSPLSGVSSTPLLLFRRVPAAGAPRVWEEKLPPSGTPAGRSAGQTPGVDTLLVPEEGERCKGVTEAPRSADPRAVLHPRAWPDGG